MGQCQNTGASIRLERTDRIVWPLVHVVHIGGRPAASIFLARIADSHRKSIENRHGCNVLTELASTNQQHSVRRSKTVYEFAVIDLEHAHDFGGLQTDL